MPKDFLVPIDLNGNELQNMRFQSLATAPAGVAGKAFYDTSDGKFKVHQNGSFVSFSVEGHLHDDRYYTEQEIDGLLAGKADGGHTHDTSHNHDAAYVDVAGDTMTGLLTLSGNPTLTNHAANKGYVDSQRDTRVAKSGDSMTGLLTLSGAPTNDLHAATKKYVDDGLATKSGTAHNHDAAYVNETDHTKAVHDAMGINAATVGSATPAQLRDRATHTGTQTAATISNFDTQVRTSRLDQMAAPTSAVAFNAQRITNLADPTSPQDAATKAYVDAARSGLDVKESVRAATTGNINLASPGTSIDGVTLSAGDRVLVKNQTNAVENGIYVWNGGTSAMTRAPDADSAGEVSAGMFTFVAEGNSHADQGWVLTTNDPVTPGTTAMNFAQFSGTGALVAGAGLVQVGDTFDIGQGNGIVVSADSIAVSYGAVGGALTVGATASNGTANTVSRSDHRHALAAPGAAPPAVAKASATGTATSPARSDHTHEGLTTFAATVGDGTATSFTLTHNLNTRDVTVVLYRNGSPYDVVMADVEHTSTTAITLRFASAPAANEYRAVVVG